MQVLVNGQAREVPDDLTVQDLLRSLGLEPDRIAVELDGLILKKPEWPRRSLHPGARLEIVHFVGGG